MLGINSEMIIAVLEKPSEYYIYQTLLNANPMQMHSFFPNFPNSLFHRTALICLFVWVLILALMSISSLQSRFLPVTVT